MNIKKIMAALACAATVGFSAQAADWFSGGIEAGWPTTAENGAWYAITNGDVKVDATLAASYSNETMGVYINNSGASNLTFKATDQKKVGEDSDSVTFESTVGFSAYDEGALPDVPANAKAAITFVATNEDATAGQFYYLAYNDAAGVESNEWVASGVYSNIGTNGYDSFSQAQRTQMTVAQGTTGFWDVKYVFRGDDKVEKTVKVAKSGDEDETVGKIEFAGYGPGYVKELKGTYAEKTVAITIGTFENMTVTNIMYNGELYGADNVRLPKGATDITVYFGADTGYKFTGGNTATIAGPVNADFTIDSTTVKAPEVVGTDVTINFFDFGENELEGAESFKGTPGTPFADSNVVLTAAASFEAQIPGTWWNGQWHAGDFETMIDFPTVFPEETGNEYYMYATNIIYRVGVEGADGVSVTINDDEVTEYTVENYDLLEAPVALSADPEEDPLGQGRTFLGWTCEYFDITEPTKKDALNCTMPENFDAWENLGDIIFVANWEEAPAQPFYVVSGGVTNGYDSFADAYENLSAGGIIVVGNSDAAIEDDFQFNEEIAWTADLNGKTLTIGDGCVLSGNLTVVDSSSSKAGSLAINGKFSVGDDAVLDLSGLTYAQTEECTGSFHISGTGKLYFPSDVTYPECLQGTIYKTTEDGAKIVVGGTTYTKSGALWVVGTTGKAVAKIGTTGYETLDAAIAAAKADDTVALLKDIETDVKEQWTISKNIELDFDNYTITKKVSNDWVFTIAKGADVTFTGLNGGISFNPIEAGNKDYPASMVQIFGKLTVDGGKYSSDFTIFKVDEDGGCSAAGELFVSNGTFEIVDAEDYEGPQWAVMNWSTATIEGGDWYGVIGTRSSDANKTVKAGQTTIGDNVSGEPEFLLYVGYKGDTTCNNLPKIKGVDMGDVELDQTSTITDELELVEDGEWVTVQKAKFDVTFEDGENSTITPAAGTSNFVYGTQLTITATAAKDYVFKTFGAEWTPNAESNVLTQVATITAAATFTAPDAEKAAPEPEPIDPSKEDVIECDDDTQATVLAAAITLDPASYVKAPAAVTNPVDAAAYPLMYQGRAYENFVFIELTDAAIETLQAQVSTNTVTETVAAALVNPEETEATISGTTAGFYYWIEGSDTPDFEDLTQAKAKMATATGESITLVKPEEIGTGGKQFYKVAVGTMDPNPVN